MSDADQHAAYLLDTLSDFDYDAHKQRIKFCNPQISLFLQIFDIL